jgi:hypothetical protein
MPAGTALGLLMYLQARDMAIRPLQAALMTVTQGTHTAAMHADLRAWTNDLAKTAGNLAWSAHAHNLINKPRTRTTTAAPTSTTTLNSWDQVMYGSDNVETEVAAIQTNTDNSDTQHPPGQRQPGATNPPTQPPA